MSARPVSHETQTSAVAEIQGLYGPFAFPEKLLQQIWDRRDFDTARAVTADGRPVRIEHTGKWNQLGGPDFKNARLRIGGATLAGDVEVHLREADWQAHRHAGDPAYANVVLHVVLFPPRCATTAGANARAIPILTLLPLLHHDLEQYAADAAVERLAQHPLTNVRKTLAALPPSELPGALAAHAEKRWRQKIHFARLRIQRLGWEAACHHTALEILGYSRNRAAMLSAAEIAPLKNWRAGVRENPEAFAGELCARIDTWARQAARPANHPRTRLRQYAAWIAARPDWPTTLLSLLGNLQPGAPAGVAAWRRASKAVALRKRIAAEICGNAIGGTRLDTLVCDGFLPLVAAQAAKAGPALAVIWRNWFVGDMPAHFATLLRALEAIGTRDTPAHNGAFQGLLGCLLEDGISAE